MQQLQILNNLCSAPHTSTVLHKWEAHDWTQTFLYTRCCSEPWSSLFTLFFVQIFGNRIMMQLLWKLMQLQRFHFQVEAQRKRRPTPTMTQRCKFVLALFFFGLLLDIDLELRTKPGHLNGSQYIALTVIRIAQLQKIKGLLARFISAYFEKGWEINSRIPWQVQKIFFLD